MNPNSFNLVTPGGRPAQFLASLLTCAFILLAACANAWGQAVEARVASVTGAATISNQFRPASALRKGTILTAGDVITTPSGARARIELSDGSIIIVLPRTRLVMQDYRAAFTLRELLKVFAGRVRIKINRFGGQPNPYRVNSPSASIGVRGTEFSVAVDAVGATRVFVYEGAVEVTNLSDPKNQVLVERGRGVLVQPNEPIRFIVIVPDNEIDAPDDDPQPDNPINRAENDAQPAAAGVYERYVDSIVDSGETLSPSRFAAFPDAHLDSLENPAYAAAFTSAQGRVFFLPAFNGPRDVVEPAQISSDNPRPFDYSLAPQGSFFVPLARYNSVVGGSLAISRHGLQSFSSAENVPLPGSPFSPGAIGSRVINGSTTNKFFNASLVFAHRFSPRASVGFGVDYLTQRDSLFNLVTDIGNNNLAQRERTDSLAEARRARFTIGLSRDIGSRGKLGIFYRYGLTSSRESNKTSLESVTQSFEQVKTTGQASEIGMRLRGSFTRRLFYGTEGNLLFGSRKDTVTQSGITESRERSRTTRATLGFGLGYAWRPRAVLSFDVTGGFARARNARRDAATGNLSETERQRAAFLSWHAAIQADIWRQLFVSGSILSVNQWRVNDLTMFSNQPAPANNFALNTRSNVHLNSYFSNVGIGWRFASNFLAEYILTTDFGGASPRHTLLIRYNFNFTGKR